MTGLRVLQLISSGGYYGAENMAMQLSISLKSTNNEVLLGIFNNAHRPNRELADAAERRGLDVELIECKGRIDFGTIGVIRKLILTRKIDIVHSHGYKANIYAYLAARETAARLVATCHNWPGKTVPLRLYASLDRFLLRRFPRIGAVSGAVENRLRRSGVPADRVRLVANGIDTESFSKGQPVLRALPQLKNKKVIGFVGRLAREKGLVHLMQAAQSIVQENANVAFLLAGDGPFREELLGMLKEFNIEDHVLLLGPRSDVADVYASTDIFVLPSLNEGMPMTVLEAMASSKPIVATAVGEIPRLIKDGETGLLVKPAKPSELTAALKKLLASPRLCESMGRRGFDRVSEHFSAKVMAETYLTMYRETGAQENCIAKANCQIASSNSAHISAVDSPAISVVIPALNEEAVIGRCLDALAKNDFPKNAFEVIVVDNGSTDRTIEIVKSFENVLSLKLITLKNAYISGLRNRGAVAARGKFLAFLDADCLAPSNWLSNAFCRLGDSHAGIVGAHYGIPDESTWVGRAWCQDIEKVGDVSYVPAGDLLVNRQKFFAVGAFDESIQTNEDFELCERSRAAGLSVQSYPDLKVTHLGTPRTLLSFYQKQRWHGTHVLTVFLRDPKKKKNRRVVSLAFHTSICLVGILTGTIIGVAGGGWGISACFTALLLLAPLVAAFQRSARRRNWLEVIPLTLLYLTFGIARARSLLNYKTWKSRSSPVTVVPVEPS
jgi:glycosyltransferase involved in cell wall biosynthesis/GT2 family glycosyltransferase